MVEMITSSPQISSFVFTSGKLCCCMCDCMYFVVMPYGMDFDGKFDEFLTSDFIRNFLSFLCLCRDILI